MKLEGLVVVYWFIVLPEYLEGNHFSFYVLLGWSVFFRCFVLVCTIEIAVYTVLITRQPFKAVMDIDHEI